MLNTVKYCFYEYFIIVAQWKRRAVQEWMLLSELPALKETKNWKKSLLKKQLPKTWSSSRVTGQFACCLFVVYYCWCRGINFQGSMPGDSVIRRHDRLVLASSLNQVVQVWALTRNIVLCSLLSQCFSPCRCIIQTRIMLEITSGKSRL